jgi:hypothetical protein
MLHEGPPRSAREAQVRTGRASMREPMKTAIAASLLLLLLLPAAQVAQAHHETGCSDTTPPFTDTCYHEYLLYNLDQPDVDILVMPSSSPYALRDLALMDQSIKAWDDGIDDLADPWLANALNLHPYHVGTDLIPSSALLDPEVIIIPAEFNPVLLAGIGLEPWNLLFGGAPCADPAASARSDPDARRTLRALTEDPAFHRHEGSPWGTFVAECETGGTLCFVVNTNFLWLPDAQNGRDMYDLNSHELGHCLGIGHVGDALDFKAKAYPKDDIMSYASDGHNPGVVLCVSTLNILALEHIYGHMLLGGSTYPAKPAGKYVHMPANQWTDDNCQQPAMGLLQVPPIP